MSFFELPGLGRSTLKVVDYWWWSDVKVLFVWKGYLKGYGFILVWVDRCLGIKTTLWKWGQCVWWNHTLPKVWRWGLRNFRPDSWPYHTTAWSFLNLSIGSAPPFNVKLETKMLYNSCHDWPARPTMPPFFILSPEWMCR